MVSFIFSGVVFLIWTLFIIRTYYAGSYGGPDHVETFIPKGLPESSIEIYSQPIISYFLALGVVYFSYKLWTLWLAPKARINVGLGKIFGFFLAHLVIVCITFFSLPESGATRGFLSLFFGILMYLIYPAALILLTRTVGLTILSAIIPTWKLEDLRIRFCVEISIGFIVFVFFLLLAGLFGVYSLSTLIIIGIGFVALSFPHYRDTWDLLRRPYFQVENHSLSKGVFSAVNPYLLSGEFAFIVLTFLISVSFISIFRPMPIGWDDLGVYMNFPKMIALNGTTLQGSGYNAWQLITGTGFLFGKSATQAFFINQLGGLLSILALILSGSYFFSNNKKRYFIALPLLLATFWYALPMIVFQQAKDMKLDPALFFFSITAVTALIGGWVRLVDDESRTFRDKWLYLSALGAIIGFAFTVKLTSLMLIIASLGFISFRVLGFGGFFGFTFLFIAAFTQAHLWEMLNVALPKDPAFTVSTSIIALMLGAGAYVCSFWKNGTEAWARYLRFGGIFILGLLIPLIPWTAKHLGEIGDIKHIKITTLINGSGGYLPPDYSKIYSNAQIQKIKSSVFQAMTSSGQSQNEDLGRYFGYESGLNNYLKLPANLTFQVNQPGEFTDITYIFLALLPVLLLFLRGRNHAIYLSIVSIALLLMSLYWFGRLGESGSIFYSLSSGLTTYFSKINLPLGYLYIFAFIMLGTVGSIYLLEKNEQNRKIQSVVIFLSLYLFLYIISAFGIVWYGIVMYFCFILLIGLMSLSFIEYDEEDEKNEDIFFTKLTLSLIFFFALGYYFVASSYPHGWSNLRQSYYAEYKAGKLTTEAGIFKYRGDYLDPIAYMNLKDPEGAIRAAINKSKNPKLREMLAKKNIQKPSKLYSLVNELSAVKNDDIQKEAQEIGQSLYEQVLYPTKETENLKGIYRIGTFMTYFIHKNRERYLDDSLVFDFNDYFYHPTPEVTVDRMKKFGLGFLLTDLNAATIDKDPRHNLTKRFERLLLTMPAKNLELIATDSHCLHIAVDDAKKGLLKGEDYIDIAGVNYESYRTMSGQEITINRNEKKTKCYNYILKKMFTEDAVSETEYSYLLDIKNYILSEDAVSDTQKLGQIMNNYIGQSWFALFRIKENTEEDKDPEDAENQTGATLSLTGQSME